MFGVRSKGDFNNLETFLKKMINGDAYADLEMYAREGVAALASATPVDTGVAADSWYYEIGNENGSYVVSWRNFDVVAGTPVVILLQYGHATGTGGYVEAYDFINPAIQPIFNKISEKVWKAVKSA